MRRLGPRASMVVFTGLVALLMSAAMSLVLTVAATGIGDDFVARWLRAFSIAWFVAWPLAMVVIPLVRRGLARWIEP